MISIRRGLVIDTRNSQGQDEWGQFWTSMIQFSDSESGEVIEFELKDTTSITNLNKAFADQLPVLLSCNSYGVATFIDFVPYVKLEQCA